MVGSFYTLILQGYWEGSVRQYFYRVSGFQVALASAGLARELPARRSVVDKRIVEGFSNLVADCCHVVKSAAKNSRGNPARELRDPALLWHCAIGEIRVETEHAAATALFWVGPIEREQECVGQQRQIEGIGGEPAGVNLVIHQNIELLVEEQVEHQHKAMPISGKAGLVIDRLHHLRTHTHVHEFWHRDGDAVHKSGAQFSVPVRVHGAEELGALDRI